MVRKLIICTVAALLSLSIFAQEHLDFLGIPIDGTVSSLVKPLKKAGFKPKEDSRFKGKFFGEPCELLVAASLQSGTAYLILVDFPAQKDWNPLKAQYEYLRMRLTALYGEPTNVREEFSYPYTEADGLRALEYGTCTWISTWAFPGGEISLTLTRDFNTRIFFTDKANLALATSET